MSVTAALLCSCTRLLGWGVLLWSAEDPPIPAGTVLPVYIKSTINQVWVAGIPPQYRRSGEAPIDKFEIPLAQLDFSSSKRSAENRAAAFASLARTYAETLQDGLPIREDPDNSSKRVYRLKIGQIIKILALVKGNPAISTTGDPLPGDWYHVLTEDGSVGYCFSYRLKLFEHSGGPLTAGTAAPESREDPDLEMVLSKIWTPESYETMIAANRINLEELAKQWRFSLGQDTGLAWIYTAELNKTFSYTGITAEGYRSWRFEGAALGMSLQDDATLAVHYQESGGLRRTVLFTALPMPVEDIIAQETERRNALFLYLYSLGPAFTSANYGALDFTPDGRFTWSGFDLLIPRIIPPAALGSGVVSMDLFLSSALASRSNGAFSLRFDRIGGGGPITVHFMYTPDERGLRVEHIPDDDIDGITVIRRASSPTVIYFFQNQASGAGDRPSIERPGEF
jgi:hypothetical protein